MLISINQANYVEDYKINLIFNDGKHKLIDFSAFLLNAKNPSTKKYLDKNLFKQYSIEYGDIVWNDYELCFPIWNLYEGKLN